MRQGRTRDAPLLLKYHLLMQQYPGYTVAALEEEDARVVEGLWAIRNAEIAVRNSLDRLKKNG